MLSPDAGGARALPRRNARRCISAAWGVLALAAGGTRAAAQMPPVEAMAVFNRVQGWVRAWEAPAEPELRDQLPIAGASVVLRLDGAVIGRGMDVSRDGLSAWRAAAAAIAQADERLPIERDVLRETGARTLAVRMTLSLELAGDFVPLAAGSLADVARQVEPGIFGVAVRLGDRTEAMFPGAILATGRDAGMAAGALIAQLAGPLGIAPAELIDPTSPNFSDALVADGRAGVYRFGVVHLAQPAPESGPVFLHRGGRIVEISSVAGVEALARFADDVAGHIASRRWRGSEPLGMVGDFDAVTGRASPLVAPPADQALAAYALLRYVRRSPAEPGQERALEAAGAILRDLAAVLPDEPQPWDDDLAAPLAVLAAIELPPAERSPDIEFLVRRCRESILASGEARSAGVRALALHRLGPADAEAAAASRDLLRAALRDAAPLASGLPWIGWALMESPGNEEFPEIALRHARSAAWSRQLADADLAAPARDLSGGLVLDDEPGARPGASTARAVASLATMLRDERLTAPDERPAEALRLLRAIRFLRQLAADETLAHMYASPPRALGGVRASLHVQRISLGGSAMTLLTLVEMLGSLEALAPAGS